MTVSDQIQTNEENASMTHGLDINSLPEGTSQVI